MTTTITSACACKAFSYTAEYQNTCLPLDRGLCLCNICRRTTGSCGISSIILPSNQTIDPANYSLKSYSSSDVLTRYFCSTCGAHCLVYVVPKGTWHLTTGLWDRTEGIVNWTCCKWVEPTLDGGISVWLNEIQLADGEKREIKRLMLQDWDIPEPVPHGTLQALPQSAKPCGIKLTAQCHCGGVRFYITRPNEASKRARSPFSDLIVPFHSHSSDNPLNKTWWLRDNDTKYLAGTCTCTSCRSASGFEFQPWAFVPTVNIFKENGEPIDFNLGTLKTYESSEEVHRDFCGVCGATVFWRSDWRPDLIDVSVGLLDPEEGARVERWLDWWTERVSFEELSVSKSLVASLEDGLKKWGEKNRNAKEDGLLEAECEKEK